MNTEIDKHTYAKRLSIGMSRATWRTIQSAARNDDRHAPTLAAEIFARAVEAEARERGFDFFEEEAR